MSSSRPTRAAARRHLLSLAACVALVAAPAAGRKPLLAQEPDLDSLRRAVATLQDSADAARRRYVTGTSPQQVAYDDTLVAAGVPILLVRGHLSSAERAALASGFERARRDLESKAPGSWAALFAGDTLGIRPSRFRNRNGRKQSSLVPGTLARQSGGTGLTHPLRRDRAEALAVGRAGQLLAALHPAISEFARGAGVIASGPENYRVVALQLARSRSAVARRCRVGVIVACRAVLGRDTDAWWDPGDAPSILTAPVTPAVQGSLLTYAFERWGTPLVAALSAAPHAKTDAVAVLAAAAETTPEQLLSDWLAQIQTSATRASGPSPALIVSSLAWSVLLAGVVFVRRPR